MITIRTGHIIGREHLRRRINCQDALAVIEREDAVIGVIADGCGSGRHSEVGAGLAVRHIALTADAMLDDGLPLTTLPAALHRETVGYLHQLSTMNPGLDFIQHYLLFTLLIVVATPQRALICTAGDGLIAVDDGTYTLDQGNQPHYIAYHLLEGAEHRPFEVCLLPPAWERIAIASDGFEPELLGEVWGIEHPRGLQRRMNVWSDREHRFTDDAAIIALSRDGAAAG